MRTHQNITNTLNRVARIQRNEKPWLARERIKKQKKEIVQLSCENINKVHMVGRKETTIGERSKDSWTKNGSIHLCGTHRHQLYNGIEMLLLVFFHVFLFCNTNETMSPSITAFYLHIRFYFVAIVAGVFHLKTRTFPSILHCCERLKYTQHSNIISNRMILPYSFYLYLFFFRTSFQFFRVFKFFLYSDGFWFTLFLD